MTKVEKKNHVEAWMTCGLPQATYCRDHGIILSTFRGWVTNYAYLSDRARAKKKSMPKLDLVPVKLAEPLMHSITASLELRTPSGHLWSLGSGHSPEWIADLIRRLG